MHYCFHRAGLTEPSMIACILKGSSCRRPHPAIRLALFRKSAKVGERLLKMKGRRTVWSQVTPSPANIFENGSRKQGARSHSLWSFVWKSFEHFHVLLRKWSTNNPLFTIRRERRLLTGKLTKGGEKKKWKTMFSEAFQTEWKCHEFEWGILMNDF